MTDIASEDLGFSDCMGPDLRKFVEGQLLQDLNRYLRSEDILGRDFVRFDWSDSCIEGHRIHWLDGEIENFSGVAMFDTTSHLIAKGWMEFVETETELHVFWWYLSGGEKYELQNKTFNGVPDYIWEKLGPNERLNWKQYAPVSKRRP